MSQGRHQMRLPQPAPQGFQNQSVLRYTLSASGLSLESSKVAVAQRLSLIRSPDAPSLCEKSGLVILSQVPAGLKRSKRNNNGSTIIIQRWWTQWQVPKPPHSPP